MDPVTALAQVPRRPPRGDLAIAGVIFAWAALEALFVHGPGTPLVRLALAAGFALPLIVRRRWPVEAMLVLVALLVGRTLLSDADEVGSMPFPSMLVTAFSIGLYARPRWLAIAAAPMPGLAMIGVSLTDGFSGDLGPVDAAIGMFIALGAWTGGWLVRRRAAQLERAREAAPRLAQEAVATERARIARELHDVVAHAVSIVSVQAGAAEELLPNDPDRAREHVRAVRSTAHEALVELRRMLGVLRAEETGNGPQPGLARLDELLEEARDAGLTVSLSEQGDRPPLSPGLDLAAFRIVQEALTNVRRHAGPVETSVDLRYEPGAIEIEVANRPGSLVPAANGGGHGLIGMRERVRLYGGTLETGPTPDGGFRVRARLPLEELA